MDFFHSKTPAQSCAASLKPHPKLMQCVPKVHAACLLSLCSMPTKFTQHVPKAYHASFLSLCSIP